MAKEKAIKPEEEKIEIPIVTEEAPPPASAKGEEPPTVITEGGKPPVVITEGGEPPVVTAEKKDLTILSDAEHQVKYPRVNQITIFNKLDRPTSIELCGGKSKKINTKTERGIVVFNQDANPACLQCPGRSIEGIQPRETRPVDVVLPDCAGSTQVNALIKQGSLVVKDVATGKKIEKFNL